MLEAHCTSRLNQDVILASNTPSFARNELTPPIVTPLWLLMMYPKAYDPLVLLACFCVRTMSAADAIGGSPSADSDVLQKEEGTATGSANDCSDGDPAISADSDVLHYQVARAAGSANGSDVSHEFSDDDDPMQVHSKEEPGLLLRSLIEMATIRKPYCSLT